MQSVANTLADLIRINSINAFYEHGPGEAEIADYVSTFFRALGLETWRQEVFPGRSNVIAKLPGRQTLRRVLLEAHMDTVSVGGMEIAPFEPDIKGGRMYGRGSCDTKAGLAGMMHAVADLKLAGYVPPCEVWMCAVVDEEYSFQGVLKLCENLTADAAIVAEPTELRCVVACKGVLRWRILAHGIAAHSAKVHLGSNAIQHMAKLLIALDELHESLSKRTHPLLGPATGNVGVIRGGQQVNFVPELCTIEIDRRMLPSETVESVMAEYQTVIDRVVADNPTLRFEQESPMLIDHGLCTDVHSDVAQCSQRVLNRMGLNSEVCGVPFGCDASKLAKHGIPSIVFGPGSIDQAHSAVEYVELGQVDQALEFYRQFLKEFE